MGDEIRDRVWSYIMKNLNFIIKEFRFCRRCGLFLLWEIGGR